MRRLFSISLLILLFSTYCRKHNSSDIVEVENMKVSQIDETISKNNEKIQSMRAYYGMKDVFAPDGKMVRVYIGRTLETQWGPIFAPVIYLFDEKKRILAEYNILELIDERFWSGDIDITYNNERNSFDMLFSLDAYGNYGTAFIDLNTNKFVRELLKIDREGTSEQERQLQGR
jgi:hypothetical protein